MSKGCVYLVKNYTGYKISFTKKILKYAIEDLNRSSIGELFIFVKGIIVNKPKKIKEIISNKIKKYIIRKDLYNLTDIVVENIFNGIKGKFYKDILKIEPNDYNDDDNTYPQANLQNEYDSDLENNSPNEFYNDSENDSESDFEDDYEDYYEDDSESDSESDSQNDSESDSQNEFVVQKIISYEGNVEFPKKMRFRIRWKGYSSKDDTMEPIKNLIGCHIFIKYINDNKKLHKLKKFI